MAVVKNLMVRAGADFSAITKQSEKAKASISGMQKSVSASCTMMQGAMSGLSRAMSALGAALSVTALVAFSKSAKAAYDTQAEVEAKLAQAMRNTTGASRAEVQAIKDLASAQQALGVIGDEVQLAGAQELSTYVTEVETLKTLIPVMNDMAAQQYGLAASADSVTSIATMLGKVLNGQTSALSRYGYSFTAAQERVLKFGDEAQRAATLAAVVSESVGGMNAALAATPSGRLQQLSNTLGDIKEQFGAAVTSVLMTFLPALNAIADVLAAIATLAGRVAQSIANVFGGKAASPATPVVSYTGAAVQAMDDLTESSEGAGKAAKEALGLLNFDKITKLTDNDASGGKGTAAESGGASVSVAPVEEGAEDAAGSIGILEKALGKVKDMIDLLDFTKTAEAFERLKKPLERLGELVGGALGKLWDNVIVPITQWTVDTALPVALDLTADALELIADTISDIAGFISGKMSLGEFFGQLKPAQTLLFGVAGALGAVAAAAGLSALANLPVLFTRLASIPAIGVIRRLGEVIALTAGGAGTLGEAIKAVFGPGSIIAGIGMIIGGAIMAITNFIAMLKNGFSWANEALMTLGLAITAVGAIILGAPAVVSLAIAGAVAAVAGAVITLRDRWGQIKSDWNELCAALKALFTTTWESIKSRLSQAGSWLRNNVFTPATDLCQSAKNAVLAQWESLKSTLSQAGGWVQSNVLTPISNGIRSLVNGGISFVEGLLNAVVKGINYLVDRLNTVSISIPDWVPEIGGKRYGFSLRQVGTVKLPRLAAGAVVSRPTLAQIGEKGPEAVVPLSEDSAWLDALASRLTATLRGSGGTSVTVPIYVAGRKVTEAVIEDVNAIIRTSGVCPIHI